jgi:hypothetical protein
MGRTTRDVLPGLKEVRERFNQKATVNITAAATPNDAHRAIRFDVDFSAFKNVQLMERRKLQFRAEFFNILNHPNFAPPNFLNDSNNSVAFKSDGSPVLGSAGVLGSTSTCSQQIQLGLKLIW